MDFHSLAHFAEHLMQVGEQMGGQGGGDGDGLKEDILRTGARMIEGEVRAAYAGTNRYGLAPLCPATIAHKGHDDYLKDSGELSGSISVTIGEDEAEIGTPLDKAVLLENGTMRMPPRPVTMSAKSAVEPRVHAMAHRKVVQHFDRRG